jgi:LacI family transcriptional regulator
LRKNVTYNDHPFFAEVAKGLSYELRKRGHSLVISSSEEDPDLEREEIDHLLARGVDALVLAPTQWTVESFREIEEQKVPYLLIDRRFAGFPAHFVGVDDELSGMMAVEHLIQTVSASRTSEVSKPVRQSAAWKAIVRRSASTT